jgi:hypothetical protein
MKSAGCGCLSGRPAPWGIGHSDSLDAQDRWRKMVGIIDGDAMGAMHAGDQISPSL